MTNETIADTTEQVKTMVASPLLITEIEDKYKDLCLISTLAARICNSERYRIHGES